MKYLSLGSTLLAVAISGVIAAPSSTPASLIDHDTTAAAQLQMLYADVQQRHASIDSAAASLTSTSTAAQNATAVSSIAEDAKAVTSAVQEAQALAPSLSRTRENRKLMADFLTESDSLAKGLALDLETIEALFGLAAPVLDLVDVVFELAGDLISLLFFDFSIADPILALLEKILAPRSLT